MTMITQAFAEAPHRGLCTDCGISRSSEPKRCGTACQFIAPDYPTAETRVHGRMRDEARPDELFFGPFRRMLRASLAPPSEGAQWTGITTRIAERLLETNAVDAILTMAPDPADRWRPMPVLVTEAADLAQCRGMRMGYAPLLALLEPARALGYTRLAIIGIPCQVYALRALEQELGFERLFVIGTPCSDNTTTERFHEFLAVLSDDPDSITYLEFRADYHVELRFRDGHSKAVPFLLLPLSKLPPDFFPLTCRTCVDYTNVLADITIGYMGGSGEQWIITRNDRGEELLALLGDQIRVAAPLSAGKRHGAVAGFMKNVERAAGGLPLRGMPDWVRPLVAWLMPRIGPRGLEFARTRVEMKAIETILHLRRQHPKRMRSMIPAHIWKLAKPYKLAPAPGETSKIIPALLLLLLACGTAHAQEANTQDKSQYDLFNPTPDSKDRAFSPDRPDKNSGPYTVDAGHFEYEIDLFGFSRDGYTTDGTLQEGIFTADPTLKLGITNTIDAEVTIEGYQTQRIKDRATSTTASAHGFGDVIVRIKDCVFGDDGGDYTGAIFPFVKIPTGATALGNNQVEGGVTLLFQFPLPYGITGLANTELAAFKNDFDSGKHLTATNLISISHEVAKKFEVAAEFWSQVAGASTPAQYTADFSLAYLPRADIQLDVGTYVGLNKAAPDLVVYAGLAQQF